MITSTNNEAFTTVSSSEQAINSLRDKYAFHPFHLTALSPWPVLTAFTAFASLSSLAMWFNSIDGAGYGFFLGALSALFVLIHWFSDVANEATLIGMHTRAVQQAHAIGVVFFITTEFMFFFAIFWAFFHSALAPTIELGSQWPPRGVEPLSPILVPLLNTALLMSSGAAVTWGHHAFFQNRRSASIMGLSLTLVLAVVFTALQAFEYVTADFTIADSVFGSCFYFSTGVHGLITTGSLVSCSNSL